MENPCPAPHHEPHSAWASGCSIKTPLVFLPFTVLDNFLLGASGGPILDRKAGRRALAETAARYGFDFDPDAQARTLTVGERQQLEMARLLWRGARVLILDEPTTGISEPQRVETVCSTPAARRREPDRDLRHPQARGGGGAVPPGHGDVTR